LLPNSVVGDSTREDREARPVRFSLIKRDFATLHGIGCDGINRIAKPLYVQKAYRGFESLRLRQFCFLPAAAPAPHWWGGYSYGPRAMSDILPILIWFVPFALPGLANLRKPAFVAAAAVFVLLAAGSIAIHAKGALWYSGYM
jgi:hypothetical protein